VKIYKYDIQAMTPNGPVRFNVMAAGPGKARETVLEHPDVTRITSVEPLPEPVPVKRAKKKSRNRAWS
jgi:hypothetical protein